MAKASDNLFPYVHLVPAAAPSSPASGSERIYLDSGDGNKLKRKNSSGTVTTIEGSGSSGGFSAYSSYTPALTAATTNPTLGTGSVASGYYAQDNKTVTGVAHLTFGTSGVAAGSGAYRISLPVAADTTIASILVGSGNVYDSSAGDLRVCVFQLVSSTTARLLFPGTANNVIVSDAAPWTWAASDGIDVTFTYRAA